LRKRETRDERDKHLKKKLSLVFKIEKKENIVTKQVMFW